MKNEDSIPLKTETTVLTADDPNELTLGFVVNEYLGSEIKLFKEISSIEEYKDLPSITDKDGIKFGDKILVPLLMGGVGCVDVTINENGFLQGESEANVYPLQFNVDDRHSWISLGNINKKCLKKLTLDSK